MNLKKGPFGVFSRVKNITGKKIKRGKLAAFFSFETIKVGKKFLAGKSLKTSKKERIFLSRPLKIIHRVFFYFFGLIFLLLSTAVIYLFFITPKAELVHRQVAQTSIIYDRTGEHKLYEIHGEENRKVITHAEIPDAMRLATITAEDSSFYEHHGISFMAIIRSSIVNLRSSGLSQGASTITQQLARNAFLTREKSWERKIKEIILALKIEIRC